MIPSDVFAKNEAKLIHLTNLWNAAESVPSIYDELFTANPHKLAQLIGQGTTFNDWQMFLADSRVQAYIDKMIYVQAGLIVSMYMKEDTRVGVADVTKLNAAIKYRDDHKPNFATPVQYIYIQTPLTDAEQEFLPNVPENNKSGI